MSFFERNSTIIAIVLIGVAVLIVLHLYGNGGNTSDASYTLRENFCNRNPVGFAGIYTGTSRQPENLTEAQVTDRCKSICTAMGTGCRWFNYMVIDSEDGCLFYADNITDGDCSSSTASTGGADKTYIKN
jgi:hypothetical protein